MHLLRLGEPGAERVDWEVELAVVIGRTARYLVLDPGDVVLTGTPEGVALSGRFPYLVPGDVVRLEIDGLGAQRQVLR